MGLLTWIKNRNQPQPTPDPDDTPRTHGHKDWKGLFAEWREDYALAKVRDETGKEPESRESKAKATRGPERGR